MNCIGDFFPTGDVCVVKDARGVWIAITKRRNRGSLGDQKAARSSLPVVFSVQVVRNISHLGPTTSERGEVNTVRSVNCSELKWGEKVWCHSRFSKDWKVLDCPAADVRRTRRIFRIINAPFDRREISLREVECLTHGMGYPPNFAISPTLRAGFWFTTLLCEGSEPGEASAGTASAGTDTFISSRLVRCYRTPD